MIHLIIGLIKKTLHKMIQHFPKTYKIFERDINVKIYLSNCATKLDLKNVTEIDTSKFAANSDLASVEEKVDKIDVGKLKNCFS